MRLTYKALDQHGKETGTVWYASTAGNSIFPKSDREEQVLKKLAAYEDTGLTPEEFKESTDFVLELNKKLKPYMDAEEHGRLVILPCKVGDSVCYLNPFSEIESGKVTMIQQKADGTWEFRVTTEYSRDVTKDAIGKTVFFTREDAEAALEGEK